MEEGILPASPSPPAKADGGVGKPTEQVGEGGLVGARGEPDPDLELDDDAAGTRYVFGSVEGQGRACRDWRESFVDNGVGYRVDRQGVVDILLWALCDIVIPLKKFYLCVEKRQDLLWGPRTLLAPFVKDVCRIMRDYDCITDLGLVLFAPNVSTDFISR